MVYLFSMDVADARFVVVCLGVMGRVIRYAALFLLYSLMVNGGWVPNPSAIAANGPAVKADGLSTQVDELKSAGQLAEARQYIADGHQAGLTTSVAAWYADGCPNVWFEMSGRDINGRRSAEGLVVQLPTGQASRAKCYQTLAAYHKDVLGSPADADDLVDTGESYLFVPMIR